LPLQKTEPRSSSMSDTILTELLQFLCAKYSDNEMTGPFFAAQIIFFVHLTSPSNKSLVREVAAYIPSLVKLLKFLAETRVYVFTNVTQTLRSLAISGLFPETMHSTAHTRQEEALHRPTCHSQHMLVNRKRSQACNKIQYILQGKAYLRIWT
jgi:hypothetical protein